MSLIYVFILIGVLIFVHEFGHFLFAKAFDVKVIRFSIGFGPKLVGFHKGETEYVICWLPLGGYVQMHGHNFESMEHIDDEDKDRALMGKPLWQRSLITFAGPLFNFILPVFLFFGISLGVTSDYPSVVGTVYPETPAAEAGLEPGDRIVAVDGERVRYFREVVDIVSDSYNETLKLTVERDGETVELTATPEKETNKDFLGLQSRTRGRLAFPRNAPDSTIAIDDPDGPAAQSGLRNFDRILAIDGESVETFREVEDRIRDSGGKPLELLVVHRIPIAVEYAQFFRQEAQSVTVQPERRNGHYGIGIDSSHTYITKVDPESPAAEAGLQGGDEIIALEGQKYGNWRMLNRRIEQDLMDVILEQKRDDEEIDVQKSFALTYERGTETHTTTLTPEVIKYTGERAQEGYRTYIGWGNFSNDVEPEKIPVPLGKRISYGATSAVSQTWQFTELTATALLRLVQGRVSSKTLGGPIMIGELAAEAARVGLEYFLKMMALISINLGLINLLPIPVLDGGHLMFYAIEAVRRKPLSYRTRQIATYIGFAIVVFLMLLAFKNDIEANWGDFVEWLNSW